MASSRFNFEIDGVNHSLYFGMASVQIYQEKAIKEVTLANERGDKNPTADPIKSFAVIVHSGLCNMADIDEVNRPTFAKSYEITEAILCESEDLQNGIFECWKESKPVKDMTDRLNTIQKKSPAKVKSKGGTK